MFELWSFLLIPSMCDRIMHICAQECNDELEGCHPLMYPRSLCFGIGVPAIQKAYWKYDYSQSRDQVHLALIEMPLCFLPLCPTSLV